MKFWGGRSRRHARGPRPWAGVRVAIVGCGTIAEAGHLPALRELGMAPALLVDRDLERARRLRDALPHPERTLVGTDVREHLDAFDAAIVAVPHHLHPALATDLLRHQKHVLLEKPMAITPEECDAIIAAAEESTAALAVGMIRRFWDAALWAREVIRSGALGEIESFDIRDGARAIAIASDFALRRETSGGGVLMNLGVHVLDEILWWFGPVASLEYRDDAYGGNEVNAELELEMESGARGFVELSFNRQLRGTALIRGTRGELEVDLYANRVSATPEQLLLTDAGGITGRQIRDKQPSLGEVFAWELADWLEAATTGRAPRVPGDAHHREIARLVGECYARRQELELPWMWPDRFEPVTPPLEEVAPLEVHRAVG